MTRDRLVELLKKRKKRTKRSHQFHTYVPYEVYWKFSEWCDARDVSRSAAVTALIEELMEESEAGDE